MKSLLLLALAAAPHQPSRADVESMFVHSDAFMRVCARAIEATNPTESQMVAAEACYAFAAGVTATRAMASSYELDGVSVCARQDVQIKHVMSAAFTLYRSSEEARTLTPPALIVVAQARSFPCR